MSAIFGIFARDGRPVAPPDLRGMQAALAHRGPDGAAIWLGGSAGLGHQMLRATPEAAYARLPLRSRRGRLVLTADVRLDNREELIAALDLRDRPPGRLPDEELLLAAYERWGEGCTQRLLGDFAFAVWDGEAQALFCARDHFGVRPLYYYESERSFAFASEIKALLSLPEVPRRLDELRVAEILVPPFQDHGRTFYQDIERLPPATLLRVDRQRATRRRYWSLDPTRELRLASDADYAEAVRAAFTDAVRCRLRLAGPPGAMLSGGLDSSSIVCVARDLLARSSGPTLQTFSAVFDGVPASNDRPFIQAVLDGGGLQPHFIDADRFSPLIDFDRVLWHCDEADGGGNLYVVWLTYEAARRAGVRVVLEGFDGDSTISHGKGLWTELAIAGRWLRLARELRAFMARTEQPGLPGVWWRWFTVYGLNPARARGAALLPAGARRALGRRGPVSARPAGSEYLNPDFVGRTGLVVRHRARPPGPRNDREEQYATLTDVSEVRVLETYNHLGGAFGLEPRFPFWDRRLVELCLALPPEQKLRDGWARLVMRRAMSGLIPHGICWRPRKTDMRPAFNRGFFGYEQAQIEQILFRDPDLVAHYFDIDALRAAYVRRQAMRASERDNYALWSAVSLALWLDQAGFQIRTSKEGGENDAEEALCGAEADRPRRCDEGDPELR